MTQKEIEKQKAIDYIKEHIKSGMDMGFHDLKNHYKVWSYCEGCEDWFLDEEDCNCEQ